MEKGIANVALLVNEILAFVRVSAQAMEIGEIERCLLPMVMAVGRAALEEFVATKGAGYVGGEIIDAHMSVTEAVPTGPSSERSQLGEAYHHAAGSPGIFPLDGELNLPERGYSYLVQEFSTLLAVTMSYEDAQEILRSFFPVKMPIRSLESIVGDVCDEVDRFYEEKPPPQASPEAVVTVATVDKKGVVIRKAPTQGASPEVPTVNPDKPGKKKMATVISTYVTPRHVRPAECILKEVSDQGGSDSRPKPQNKLTWGSLTDETERTVARLKKVVDQRLPEGNELVCILDL